MTIEAFDFGDAAEIRVLEMGDVLCEEGRADTEVFAIVSGSVDVLRATAEGPLVVATMRPGHVVGEVSNAMGGNRTATLRAAERTVVSVLSQVAFGEWLDAHPDSALAIAAEARLRLNRTRAADVLVRLFGLDNREVVDAVVAEIGWITLGPGKVLFAQHDVADAAYLVIAGRLHVQAHDASGNISLDLEIGRGEIVGEMGIIEDALRSAGARAMRETTLARISRESFDRLTVEYPALLLRVFHTIIDRLTHQHEPDERARVVGIATTARYQSRGLIDALVGAVEPFGSTLHLSADNLGRFVRDVDGPGASSRIAEFLHEADVGHDYVVLEGASEFTPWSASVATQSDRLIVICSAQPDRAERARIREHLDELTADQRAQAWVARLHPPGSVRPTQSASFIDNFAVGEIHNVRADKPADLARLGRLATGNGVGVVLGGGGAKGIAHIGALRALDEADVVYDRIAGASIGAVLAAAAAQGMSPLELLDAAIVAFNSDLLDFTVPAVSLIKAAKITKGIRDHFDGWDITDLWLPFYCVSTNLTTAELCVHRRGSVTTATRASLSIPVVLPPVSIDGEHHVDGGVLDNVPVSPMVADSSIGTVIAIDVSPAGGAGADTDFGLSVSGFDVLRRRMSRRRSDPFPSITQTLMNSMLIGSSKAKNVSSEGVDLYLTLNLDGIGLLEFKNHAAVAQRGYDEAKPAIARWLSGNQT